MSATPPPWLVRIARGLVPAPDRDLGLADLREDFARRAARGQWAVWWFLIQTLHLAIARPYVPRAGSGRPGAVRSGGVTLATFWQDARFGARLLRRQPVFAVIAVASLAVGIGLNSAIFGVVDALLFRPLPVRAPESLVTVFTSGEDGMSEATTSWPDLQDIRARNHVFSDVIGHTLMFAAVNVAGERRLAFGEVVSGNYFSTLGVVPVVGRGFLAEEERGEGTHPVVVISHRLWQTALGGREDVLTQHIVIKNRPYAVVGVTPSSFTGLTPGVSAEMWVPVSMVDDISPAGMNDSSPSPSGKTRLERRGMRWLFVNARLREGVAVAAAAENLKGIDAALEREYPVSNVNRHLRVYALSSVRFHPMIDRALRPAAALVMGAVGLLLLAACANLASMLLARGAVRRREMALRAALGAGRRRLMRQMLVESLMLSTLGGAAGLLLAMWTISLLMRAHLPTELPIAFAFAPGGRIVLFNVTLSLATGFVFGVMPAWRVARTDLVPALTMDAAAVRPGRRFGLRHVLVGLQVAVSVVLITTGVLLARSFVAARSTATGFETRDLVVATVSLDMQGYDDARARVFFDEASSRLGRLPGTVGVAVSQRVPFSPNVQTTTISIDGHPELTPPEGASLDVSEISGSYFDTLGIRLVDGRTFDTRDTPSSSRVAVISQAFARKYFSGAPAVGRRLRLGRMNGPAVEIVGVAADYSIRTIGEAPRPVLHLARSQRFSASASFLVRGAGEAGTLQHAIEHELRALEPNLVFIELSPMARMIATSLLPVSLGSALLGGLALLAALLAALGLYGVVAFTVANRRREIGIRMALGASRAVVVRTVMAEALTMTVVGAAAGGVLAAAGAQALAAVLYGVTPLDPVSYATAVLFVGATAFVSSVWPARRAASIDPVAALRS